VFDDILKARDEVTATVRLQSLGGGNGLEVTFDSGMGDEASCSWTAFPATFDSLV
jgi:hypothetical protein